jgi:hypothetical protein
LGPTAAFLPICTMAGWCSCRRGARGGADEAGGWGGRPLEPPAARPATPGTLGRAAGLPGGAPGRPAPPCRRRAGSCSLHAPARAPPARRTCDSATGGLKRAVQGAGARLGRAWQGAWAAWQWGRQCRLLSACPQFPLASQSRRDVWCLRASRALAQAHKPHLPVPLARYSRSPACFESSPSR